MNVLFHGSQRMATKKSNTAKKTSGKKTTKPRTIKVVEETDAVDANPATDAKKKKSKAEPQDKKLSALDAAAKVLAESSEPLNTKQMVDAMAAKGYWTSPGGKTPHATLYSAILREITTKGTESRFKKTERGHFAPNN
jgi:hypothetical protein